MNKELVAIDNRKKASDFKFDRPASVEATVTRVSASKALRSYGDLLAKLVSEDRGDSLKKAASSLIENTSLALDEDISDESRTSLTNLIVGLGSFWVEKKKADAARKIIPAFEHPVNQLADLLANDFSLTAGALGYLKAYESTARRLKNASMRLVNAGNQYTVLERDRAVQALVLSGKALSRATEIDKRATRAIDGLKTANAELVKIINDESYITDDIESYAKQIQELVNVFQVLAQ